jgi:hypothetical protein
MTLLDWLPITKKETDLRGWDEVDIVFVTAMRMSTTLHLVRRS